METVQVQHLKLPVLNEISKKHADYIITDQLFTIIQRTLIIIFYYCSTHNIHYDILTSYMHLNHNTLEIILITTS